MCGIVGFTQPGSGAESLVRQMMASIRYRGPDEEGFYIDSAIACGHVRLAIVEPNGGQQPRVNEQNGDVLLFNGEIYNFRAHAKWLQSEGITLKDGSDTEVLYQMIQYLGVDKALAKLDGMFAFAFREGESGDLYLVRDRFGEKPLFFAQQPGTFIFGSEVKSLLQHPALQQTDFDFSAISAYLALDYAPAPSTGILGIEKLRPGEIVKYSNGELHKHHYWLPSMPSAGRSQLTSGTIDSLTDDLGDLLDQSIKSRLVADVPVGLFLSGGIDSACLYHSLR